MKKKMQLWEKESNEILKVKNLCIGSDMIKKHTRVHFAPIKTLLLSKNGNSSNQNFVAERRLKLFTLQSEPIKTLLLDKRYKSIAR